MFFHKVVSNEGTFENLLQARFEGNKYLIAVKSQGFELFQISSEGELTSIHEEQITITIIASSVVKVSDYSDVLLLVTECDKLLGCHYSNNTISFVCEVDLGSGVRLPIEITVSDK